MLLFRNPHAIIGADSSSSLRPILFAIRPKSDRVRLDERVLVDTCDTVRYDSESVARGRCMGIKTVCTLSVDDAPVGVEPSDVALCWVLYDALCLDSGRAGRSASPFFGLADCVGYDAVSLTRVSSAKE